MLEVQAIRSFLKLIIMIFQKNELFEIEKYIGDKSNDIAVVQGQLDNLKTSEKDIQEKINSLKQISKDFNKRSVPLMKQLDEANIQIKGIDAEARYKTERMNKNQNNLKLEMVVLNEKMCDYEKLKKWAEEIGAAPKVKR